MLTFIDYLNENNDQVNDIQSIKTRKLLWKPEKSFKENAKLIEDKVLNFFKERFTSDDIGVFALYRWDELEELAKITNEYVNLMNDFEKGKGLIQKNISRGEKLFHEIASGMRNN
jgi:hypothetical protein